jgi:hypothetical protein
MLTAFEGVVNYIVFTVFGTIFVQVSAILAVPVHSPFLREESLTCKIFYTERAYRLNKTIAIPILAGCGV